MREGIHPKYEETTITCACGNVIHTRSTKKDIKVEICSKCHPFYTGQQKSVAARGAIDKFNRKYGLKQWIENVGRVGVTLPFFPYLMKGEYS